MIQCNKCLKEYSSKYTLKVHQERSKICGNTEKRLNLTCKGCNKILSSKEKLNKHVEICIEHKKNSVHANCEQKINLLKQELVKKDEIITSLNKTIENIALQSIKQPKKIINNTINIKTYVKENFDPITHKLIEDSVHSLTINHIADKGEGFARHALTFVKDMVLCTDRSRLNFLYLWLKKELHEDPMLVNFRKEYFTKIESKANELVNDFLDKNPEDDLEVHTRYKNIHFDVSRERIGKTTKLTSDFVKTIANHTRNAELIGDGDLSYLGDEYDDRFEVISDGSMLV